MNNPAERLFTVVSGAGEDAQRIVRANDAHFTSFVSGLLSTGWELTRRGEIALVDPEHRQGGAGGSARCEDAVGSRRAHGHRHDSPRPHRGHRARAVVRAAEAGIGGARGQGAGRDRGVGAPERIAAQAGARAGAGVGGQIPVPGQRVARAADAAERDSRLCGDDAAGSVRRIDARRSGGTCRASTRMRATCSR